MARYLTVNIKNEIYALKEMLQQPDRKYFENTMYEEGKAIFTNKIWEKVCKSSMYSCYNSSRKSDKDVKRQQIMII